MFSHFHKYKYAHLEMIKILTRQSYSGHCKKLAPEYAAAAKVLAEQDPAIPLGKVDATEQKKIAEKYGIQGFPTLFFFK